MFTFVSPASIDLSQSPFVDHAVSHNRLCRILKSREVSALQWYDGGAVRAIAAHNPGVPLWLWVDPTLNRAVMDELLSHLCMLLGPQRIAGVVASPEVAGDFAHRYAHMLAIKSELTMRMQSYHCLVVQPHAAVPGHAVIASTAHRELVAEYCGDFVRGAFGKALDVERQMARAEFLIHSANLYLWEVDNRAVSMAFVADRSRRHACINHVYTPPEHRGHGYASALVASISSRLHIEGLIPMLYADMKNATANRIYRDIGYQECGEVNEYRFQY